ncbi:DUF3267 domain-containing protein [Natrialba sp. PRR66]|uniref:DUF3267 domain-containing protein n=1 Tax=Natrialba sp. PRR66 TaxID=3098146 RepID=UPI002B1D5019|nr:DUF3267 domain-containing protein [Natrialba sp. PRR66]
MSPPEDSTPWTEFTLTRRIIRKWTLLGTAMAIVSAIAFTAVYGLGTGQATIEIELESGMDALVGFGLFVGSTGGVIVLHEAIHAAMIRYYGGDVSYGVGVAGFVLPYAYVTSTQRFTRGQFVAVALAPLVVITLAGLPLAIVLEAPVLVLVLALNAGGAVGDVWMVAVLRRYPSHVVVEDSKTGLRVYGAADDSHPRARIGGFLRQVALGSTIGFGILIIFGASLTIVLPILGTGSFTLGVPDTAWSLFEFESNADGFDASVNAAGFVAVSLLLGVGYAVAAPSRILERKST